MTIQMKATEQYFPVVLFILLYKVVLTLEGWRNPEGQPIHSKATDQSFLVGLFIALYKLVLMRMN